MKAWKNITLNFPGLKLDGIVDQLSYLDVLSVTVKDKRALEKSDWFDDPHTPLPLHGDTHLIILLMEASRSTHQLLKKICLILDLDQTPAYSEDVFEDRNWVTHTQAQFKEIQVSKTLRILPPWESKTEFVGKTLIIEPGSGFGTGSHPTTQLCLRWLEKNVNKNDSVLDYGCGSGILSIGAKLLGADHVEGVEIDQLAINNANQNNELNGTAIPFHHADTFKSNRKYDVVVANILSSILIRLTPTIGPLIGHKLVLSGILKNQSKDVIHAYLDWIKLSIVEDLDGWVLIAGQL